MHLDPTSVAQDFENQTAEHADDKPPGAVSNAQPHLQKQNHNEDGHVGCICRQVGNIANGSLVETARLQGAVPLLDCEVTGGGHVEMKLEVRAWLERYGVERGDGFKSEKQGDNEG